MASLLAAVLLAGCMPQDEEVSLRGTFVPPTPTLFGTTVKTPTNTTPTLTPEPTGHADVCVFPVDSEHTGVFSEAALYRIRWQPGDNIISLETRSGPLNLNVPINTDAGTRKLLILHRGEMPKSLKLSAALKPGSTMLIDAESGATELRDPDDNIHSQTIHDPLGDVGAAKPALDIIAVERQIADEGGFIVRLTTAAADDEKYEWSFENVELLLGKERYTRRILQSGKVVNLHYDSEGNYTVWEGTLIVQANTLTWALKDGAEQPFSARSATSAARTDSTDIFPADAMRNLWQASLTSCD